MSERGIRPRQFHRNMTMREKANYRRQVEAHHRSNFTAGRRQVDVHVLTRTGLRGRKSLLVVGGIIVTLLLAIAELVWTCVILSTLRFDTKGMPAIQFLSGDALRFTQPTHTVSAVVGQYIGSFLDRPLTVSAESAGTTTAPDTLVQLRADLGTLPSGRQRTDAILSRNGLSLTCPSFELYSEVLQSDSSRVNATYFLVNNSHVIMPVPDQARSLEARLIQTPKVLSVPRRELHVSSASGQTLHLDGLEETRLSGRQVTLSAPGMTFNTPVFQATAQNLTVDMSRWPLPSNSTAQSPQTANFILCACRSSTGTILFRVPASPQRCRLPAGTQLPDGC